MADAEGIPRRDDEAGARFIFSAMLGELQQGKTEAALEYMSPHARPDYEPVIAAVDTSVDLTAGLSELGFTHSNARRAEGVFTSEAEGTKRLRYAQFVNGLSGWEIREF